MCRLKKVNYTYCNPTARRLELMCVDRIACIVRPARFYSSAIAKSLLYDIKKPLWRARVVNKFSRVEIFDLNSKKFKIVYCHHVSSVVRY